MDKNGSPSPGQLINRIARLGARWMEPKLVPVIGAIKQFGPRSQNELTRLLHVEQPTMAQLLRRMERDGLVVRTPDPADGRSSPVTLTPLAVKRSGTARELLQKGSRVALKGLSPDEIELLTGLLARILANLEEALEG